MPDLIDREAAVRAIQALALQESGKTFDGPSAYLDGLAAAVRTLAALPSPTCATCAEWQPWIPALGKCNSGVYHTEGGYLLYTPPTHSCAAYKPKESRPVPSDPLSIANEFAATMRRAAK